MLDRQCADIERAKAESKAPRAIAKMLGIHRVSAYRALKGVRPTPVLQVAA